MNILIYFENVINPQAGGTERATENLAKEFINKKNSVIFLSKYKNSYISKVAYTYFLPTEQILSAENKQYVENLIKRKKIDVLINEGGNTSDVQFFNHKFINVDIKIITVLHFCTFQGFGKYYYNDVQIKTFRELLKLAKMPINRKNALNLFKYNYCTAIKHTDAFVVLSNAFKKELLDFTKLYEYEKKVHVIPNINTYSNVTSPSFKQKNVLYVGRMQYKTKRLDRLLSAWKILQSEFYDWKLDIVGEGPDRNLYQDIARTLNLQNVHFYGMQDPEPFYKKAKIVALTSTHESFGMTLIEGMTFGAVPVVYGSYTSLSDIVIDKQNGLVITPFSITEYANALRKLMKSESSWTKLSQNAIISVHKFSNINIVNEWEKLIKNLFV